MLQAEKYVALLAKSLSEYESVQLGSTNGISASTPQTSSFAVTPSSADTTTFESNTFGSNLAFVQDRLSAERYFSRGNHYEEYRDYWENGNYTFSRNENPELVYVRARDIEGVYLSDRELGNPEGFWTRNGREGWSRENILRRASHIQDVRQNTESGMSLDELSQNPVLDDTIRSYYNNPVQVAQVGQAVGQGAEGGVIHGAVHLLAVPGDEGDGVALVQQGDDILNMLFLAAQLTGQNLNNGFHCKTPLCSMRVL